MSNVARIGHICVPQTETVMAIVDGKRSSVREVCASCGQASVWIARADGKIVPLVDRRKR